MEIDLGSFVLRPYRSADAGSLRAAADNPKIAANLRDAFPSPYTAADAREFITSVVDQDPAQRFAIARDDTVIGGIGLHPQAAEHRRCAEIGFFLAEPEWGQGIMTKVVAAIVDYGFATFDLERIYATVFECNPASRRVLEKAGFDHEGTLRRAVVKDDRIMDMDMYARLREAGT